MKAVALVHLATLGLAGLAPADVAAQAERQACGPREQIVSRLAERYGETRQSIGLNAADALMEVFASLETGTWTITLTRPDGTTCLIASGQAFETLREALPAPTEDA